MAIHEKAPGPIDDPRAAEFRAWIKAQPGFVAGWHQAPPGGPVGMKPVQMELFRQAIAF